MSLTAIATFIRFKDGKGALKYRYQNAVPGKTIFSADKTITTCPTSTKVPPRPEQAITSKQL